ncbi:glucokinase, partial [Streptomyces sp. DvalAA-14]|uniref:ROK family protein n=1 Tax=unclassified Streptomyces TaxID=2593676 RepID=UPI00081BA9EB
MSPSLYLGADIGGTKIDAVLTDEAGEPLAQRRVLTPAQQGPRAVLDAVVAALAELRALAPADATVRGAGIGTHGVVTYPEGVVAAASQALPGWTGTPLREAVADRLGLPVFVDNDVNVLAYGELALGAGRGHRDLVFVTVGTGVGGAVIAGGQIVRGRHGSGGEVGHAPSAAAAGLPCSCGATGHLDAIASGTAIQRAYAEAAALAAGPGTSRIMELAALGDPIARQVVGVAAGALGEAIAGLVSVLDPALVIVAGGVAASGATFWDPMRHAVRTSTLPLLREVRMVRPGLGQAGAALGAAALARDELTLT